MILTMILPVTLDAIASHSLQLGMSILSSSDWSRVKLTVMMLYHWLYYITHYIMSQKHCQLIVHFLFWNTRRRDYLLERFAFLHRFLLVPFPTAILLFLFPSSLFILLFIENVGSRMTIRHQPLESRYRVCRNSNKNTFILILFSTCIQQTVWCQWTWWTDHQSWSQ